jgi:hypothetical protein
MSASDPGPGTVPDPDPGTGTGTEDVRSTASSATPVDARQSKAVGAMVIG